MAGIILPDAPWRRSAGLGLLCRTLGSDEGLVRLVGGAVRDGLAERPVSDIDLATSLTPAEVMARLDAAKIKVVPTGLAHGTVSAVLSSGSVEITTLRRDVTTDGRRATVSFTDDWREDAARRDFTINALSADPFSGQVYDYFGGIDDLAAGRVAFIGDPLRRIAEDHLRIMRFFRFHARYGHGVPDAAAINACTQRANDLMALSRERIADELLKILALPDPAPVVALMIAHGIFAPVLPEIANAAPLAKLVTREAEAATGHDPLRRLAALIAPDPQIADAIAARLKLSKYQRKRLACAAARVAADADDPRALAYWHGREGAIDRLLLGDGDARGIADWAVPTFPLHGGAIVARGVSAGPAVARLLKIVERKWVSEGFPGRARASDIADAVVAQSLDADAASSE